jgi:ribosomal protein S18 acetylase RimI-like enzyme
VIDESITRAGPSDIPAVADLIGAAFQHLEVSRWLVPDPELRARILPRNFEIFIEYGVTHGTVEIAGDLLGASVWLPLDGDPLPPPHDYDDRVLDACGEWTENFRRLDELFESHHPHEPHHHLAFMAVRSDQQRNGIGSDLLRHYHQRLDSAGTAAFLEASSTGSRDLYQRHGYTPLGEPYAVPNGALFFPMWRAPR